MIYNTPGFKAPWIVGIDRGGKDRTVATVVTTDGNKIASVEYAEYSDLIAAAPELQASVEMIVEYFEKGFFKQEFCEDVLPILRAALAKSKGE